VDQTAISSVGVNIENVLDEVKVKEEEKNFVLI